ncbi:hypothetical protein SNE40_006341 [Patella caerulea]|uniref:Uncharacterized protein n=1 Tax=Patella caerulea TaxID=87958 RepID=A0AAN8JVS1_PATCE
MNWWILVAISALTTTYVQADTCAECISAYDSSGKSCTEATTYLTCANAATNDACSDTETSTATKAVSDKCTVGGTCTACSNTYTSNVDLENANKCTVATTYVTCLDGVNDDCGTTSLADTKTEAAKKKDEYCNSAGSLTVSMVFTSLMMAVVSLVRV